SVEPSRFNMGAAYVAANRYQLDDFRPYLWKTADYGRTWTRIDNGIAATEFTRVLREDEERPGLLYAGTERGVWFSLTDGRTWQRLQFNLPPVPIHDLAVKEGDLVAGTHGRSFWILDDLSALRQMTDPALAGDAHLFKPRDAYRVSWGGGRGGGGGGAQQQASTSTAPPGTAPVRPVGSNPPSGAVIQYWLRSANQEVTLEFLDAQGRLVRRFTSRLDSAAYADSIRREQRRRSREDSLRTAGLSQDSIQKLTRVTPDAPAALTTDEDSPRTPPVPRAPNRAGVNAFTWNMRYPEASSFQGLIMWAASTQGPVAPPGGYQVRLLVNGRPAGTQTFRLLKDPRVRTVTQTDLAEQFDFLIRIRDRVSEANDAVKTIRYVRQELSDRQRRLSGPHAAAVRSLATPFLDELSSVEDSIYQTRNRSGQDPLNYPIRLNNKIAALMGVVGGSDNRPTAQSYAVFNQLSAQLDRELGRMRRAMDGTLPRINEQLRSAGEREIVPRAVDVPAQQQVAGGS
ncbi:MAG: WD40/YVTN/BNR-like repeat-containing protein, partial [Gemmatimonadaceae bacterium]